MSMKIGVFICECGPNIAEHIDIDSVIKKIVATEEFKDIELVIKRHKLLCSNEGQEFLEKEIISNELTHLVIAACSPRDHESTFINVCKKTPLNPYLFKMVNIREQCAWIIPDKEEATNKAARYIRAAIRRVLYQSELLEREIESRPDVLIIGGGIAGLEAALSLASKERKVYLVEKKESLGGKASLYNLLLPRQSGGVDEIQKKIQDVENSENIQVFTETEVESVVGFFGNFEIVLKSLKADESRTELKAGGIVVATGFDLVNPQALSGYKYTKDDDVYTSLEIEKMIYSDGKVYLKSGEQPRSVTLVNCVGRDEKGYCSRICCGAMIKIAKAIRDLSPDIKINVLYRDLCLPHKEDQRFFDEVKESGVDFIRVKGIKLKERRIEYTGMDGSKSEITSDMVILAPAMVPAEGTEELAEILGIPLDETGFFQEAHYHLNPVSTTTEGIYIVGAANGPQGISESILQAQAACGKILTRLIPGEKIVPEVKVSEILESFCTGCRTCLEVCCYGAIYFDEEKGVSVVNDVICRGCGNCAASCPSGAIQAKHFTSRQLYTEMIEAIR